MRKFWSVVLGVLLAGIWGLAQMEVVFWSAPNPPQEVFWRRMAEAYMAEHPQVRIAVSPIPETPTSEAGILAAIAGGVAPTASENIFVGFGEELRRSEAIVPWNSFANWDQIVAARAWRGQSKPGSSPMAIITSYPCT